MNTMKFGLTTIIMGFLITGCSNSDKESFESLFEGDISHVHGMGYAGNDNGLYVASHIGLKIYRNGEWFTTSDFHDYMGFNAIDEGFFTSGHPSADSDLPNPLGIQKSLDGGRSLEHIAFQGETDFHMMAVGYESHDIFLMNTEKNSMLDSGFYKSMDAGANWEAVKAFGLEGEVTSLALHPTDSKIVAAATTSGIYLSKDGGDRFIDLTQKKVKGTAVFLTDHTLYFASSDTAATLTKFTLESEKSESLNLPNIKEEEVVFITKNPVNEELVIYTMGRQFFLSEDESVTWTSLQTE